MERLEGTLAQVEGRYVVRIERRLSHEPERVWRALTEPGELSHWFPADISGALEPGATLRFSFREGEAPPSDGEVLAVEPGRVLAFSWQGEVLRWEVHPEASGCRLVFTHTFDDGPGAATFATGWGTCLDALDARLAGETSSSAWSPVVHDRYVQAFGLDQGTATTDADAWRVRFVRQLTKPAQTVWALLVEGGEPTGAALDGLPADQVTSLEAPDLLAYRAGEATVRWALAPGPGGARATLTVAGPVASISEQQKAYEAAHARLDQLAADLRAG
jgi:uncharacterized protein YndB with AHSA1/START domain